MADPILGRTLNIQPDLVVLASAVLPNENKVIRPDCRRQCLERHLRHGRHPQNRHEPGDLSLENTGGLLISIPGAKADALLAKLKDDGISHAAIIGEVTDAPEHITMI